VVYDKRNETVSDPDPHQVPVNKGLEASAFLQYVLDHWDHLPTWTFFTHGDDRSWHHEGSLTERLEEAVSSRRKFFNINRCRSPAWKEVGSA
jgi:hypothetical protein